MTGSFFVQNGKYQGEYVTQKIFHGRGIRKLTGSRRNTSCDTVKIVPLNLFSYQELSGLIVVICTMENS